MKLVERHEAERLPRQDGLSVKAIAARLGVSTSSVGRWFAHIELTPAQRRALEQAGRHSAGRLRGADLRRRGAHQL